jgi:hypothetical protein
VIRWLAIAGGLALALAVLFVGSLFAASELGGEVVRLTTFDASGTAFHTHLWVVDTDGSSWLRAGNPSSGWLVRIRSEPHVLVERSGTEERYRAVPVPDPATRDRIHALMRQKYGWADHYISLVRDGTRSVAVRLEPDTGS